MVKRLTRCQVRERGNMFVDVNSHDSLETFRAMAVREYKVSPWLVDRYLSSLVSHIKYVQEAGKKLGVPEEQLEIHDQSKFSIAEFGFYAKHFHGGGDPDGFALAWLHHIHKNPHHWQHWIFPDGFTPKDSNLVESGVVAMLDNFALEMIADWMGASRVYTGSWNMHDWLIKNAPRIRLHSETRGFVIFELTKIGYGDTVNAIEWCGNE